MILSRYEKSRNRYRRKLLFDHYYFTYFAAFMKHTQFFTLIFSLIFTFSARAQYLDISTPGMATIQYDHAQGIASFVFPMEEIPIEWPAEVTECIVLPDYSEQMCIVTEKYIDGVPLMWVYAIRGYAEVHIPSLGAVYTTGNRSDVLLAPKPNCYLHLIEAHPID